MGSLGDTGPAAEVLLLQAIALRDTGRPDEAKASLQDALGRPQAERSIPESARCSMGCPQPRRVAAARVTTPRAAGTCFAEVAAVSPEPAPHVSLEMYPYSASYLSRKTSNPPALLWPGRAPRVTPAT